MCLVIVMGVCEVPLLWLKKRVEFFIISAERHAEGSFWRYSRTPLNVLSLACNFFYQQNWETERKKTTSWGELKSLESEQALSNKSLGRKIWNFWFQQIFFEAFNMTVLHAGFFNDGPFQSKIFL